MSAAPAGPPATPTPYAPRGVEDVHLRVPVGLATVLTVLLSLSVGLS